jgi:hypothetical protein
VGRPGRYADGQWHLPGVGVVGEDRNTHGLAGPHFRRIVNGDRRLIGDGERAGVEERGARDVGERRWGIPHGDSLRSTEISGAVAFVDLDFVGVLIADGQVKLAVAVEVAGHHPYGGGGRE